MKMKIKKLIELLILVFRKKELIKNENDEIM